MEHRPDEAPAAPPADPRAGFTRALTAPLAPVALVIAAFVIALATQVTYAADAGFAGLWLGFVLAGVLFAAAAYGATRVPATADGGASWVSEGAIVLTRRQEWAILAAILRLAIFFRWFRFLEFPPGLWYDEAINGTDAISIIERDHLTVWRESNFGHSTIFFYLLIASFWLFDFTVFAMRMVPAIAGLAAVFAFYWLARWLAGPVPALCPVLIVRLVDGGARRLRRTTLRHHPRSGLGRRWRRRRLGRRQRDKASGPRRGFGQRHHLARTRL